MKITLQILAGACVLWVLLPLVALALPGPSPLQEFWTTAAIEDAEKILASSDNPTLLDDTKLSVSRKTLILLMLTAKTKDPERYQRDANVMHWISCGFALLAGIALVSLSRKRQFT